MSGLSSANRATSPPGPVGRRGLRATKNGRTGRVSQEITKSAGRREICRARPLSRGQRPATFAPYRGSGPQGRGEKEGRKTASSISSASRTETTKAFLRTRSASLADPSRR